MRVAITAMVAWALTPAAAVALGPGDLDESFGTDGVAVARLGPLVEPGESRAAARALALMPDGRIVVAGSAPLDGERAVAVARFRADGKLDRSFGTRGTTVVQLGQDESAAAAVAVDPAGNVLVAGISDRAERGSQGVLVAGLDSDGGLDWSRVHQLGTGPGPGSAARDLVRQADGPIVVVGRASTEGPAEPFVARFDPADGSLDPSFAGGAGYLIDPAFRDNPPEGCQLGGAEAGAVALGGDGRIILGGSIARTCGGSDAAPQGLLRGYFASGERDFSFGTGDPGLSSFSRMVPAASGGFLAAGSAGGRPGLARLDTVGQPDPAFTVPADLDAGVATALEPQGYARMVTALDFAEGPDVLVRLLDDGDEDAAFATDGFPASGLQSPRALAIARDDSVIVAGDRPVLHGQEEQGFFLARLFGGDTFGRVRVGGRAPLRAGAAVVKLTCQTGPACEGVVGGRNVGTVAYDIPGGGKRRLAVPVQRKARRAAAVEVRVTNPPAPAERKRVRLGR